jgi:DNA helicase-2/ATP-dependent DNA helicase PcrA
VTFVDALRRWDDAGASARSARGIEAFLDLIDDVATHLADGPAAVIEQLLQRSGYVGELEAERTVEADSRLENLSELVGLASEFETVDEFLEQVSLVADTDSLPDPEDPSDTGVVLMTLHSAKGLEFPVVFLVGMEEGVFPHMRSLTEPAQLEEERRLCYVGITRARQRLFLSNAWCRTLHGSTQYNPPSRFLSELPEHLVEASPASRSGSSRRSRGGWSSTSWDSGGGFGADRSGRDGGFVPSTGSSFAGPRPPESTGAHELGIRVGDDVRHNKWGEGVVLLIEGSGEKAEAVVRFPEVGEKRLLLSWAPLEKLSR